MTDFLTKLDKLMGQGLKTMLTINPTVERMPLPIRRYDDPFLPFGKAVINATRDLVCGYLFNFADYMALGAAGAVALERTIAYAGFDRLSIIHGPFANKEYVRLLDVAAFNADAITFVYKIEGRYAVIDGNAHTMGKFDLATRCIMVNSRPEISIAGDDVLYADFGEDFAMIIQKVLKDFNDKHHS